MFQRLKKDNWEENPTYISKNKTTENNKYNITLHDGNHNSATILNRY